MGGKLLLGNYLAGGKVLVKPEVTTVPLVSGSPHVLEYPEIFTACALTRAMSEKEAESVSCGYFVTNDIVLRSSLHALHHWRMTGEFQPIIAVRFWVWPMTISWVFTRPMAVFCTI